MCVNIIYRVRRALSELAACLHQSSLSFYPLERKRDGDNEVPFGPFLTPLHCLFTCIVPKN
jgi:hypothetical protein